MHAKPLPIVALALTVFCFTMSAAIAQQSTQSSNQEMAQELLQHAVQLYQQKQYADAGRHFVKVLDFYPNHRIAAFNGACSYSLANDKTNAIKYARIAFDLGMLGFDADKDFDNVRNTKEFKTLLADEAKLKKELANQPIDPVIIAPRGFSSSKKYPLVVAIHGYSGNPQNFAELYRPVAEKYNCVLLLSRGSEAIGKGQFAWNYSPDEYKRVMSEIEKTIKSYNVDLSKIVLTGFSQGGRFTYDFGLKHADMFCGLLPVAGNPPDQLTADKLNDAEVKVFSIVGTQDNPALVDGNKRAKKTLAQKGVDIKLKTFPIGHTYPENSDEVLGEALAWFLNE